MRIGYAEYPESWSNICPNLYAPDYDCYCLTDESRIQPLCAIYSKAMLPLIEEAMRTGDHKLMNLLRKARVKYISLEYTCFGREILANTVIRKPKKKTFLRQYFA